MWGDDSLDFPVCRPPAFSSLPLITFSAKALSHQNLQKTKMFRYLLGFMIFGLEAFLIFFPCVATVFFLFNVFCYTLKFSTLLLKIQASTALRLLSVTRHNSASTLLSGAPCVHSPLWLRAPSSVEVACPPPPELSPVQSSLDGVPAQSPHGSPLANASESSLDTQDSACSGPVCLSSDVRRLSSHQQAPFTLPLTHLALPILFHVGEASRLLRPLPYPPHALVPGAARPWT